MRTLLLALIVVIPLFVNAQDQITLLDGKTYDVKITRENSLNIYFYNLSDSLQTRKVILKEMLLSYKIAGEKIKKSKIRSPGDELMLASSHWYLGLAVTIVGPGIAGYGLSTNNNAFMIVGGIISLVGIVYMIESWSHIGKAGQLMNRPKIGLTFNQGIGLRYRI